MLSVSCEKNNAISKSSASWTNRDITQSNLCGLCLWDLWYSRCLPSDQEVVGSSAVNSSGRSWALWVYHVRRTSCRWCSGTDLQGQAGSGRWNTWNTGETVSRYPKCIALTFTQTHKWHLHLSTLKGKKGQIRCVKFVPKLYIYKHNF